MDATTWLALIALREPVLPDPREVIARYEGMAPDEAPLVLSSETESMAVFQSGESTMAYTLVDRPIPAEQLRGPCECAWYWPEALSVMSNHTSHLIVALVDEGRDLVAKGMKLTRLGAALLADNEALGLQWGGSRQVHEPLAFRELASQMAHDDLPLYLWIDFRVEGSGPHTWRLFTTGLEAFGRREIEVALYQGDPQDLVNHVYNIAHFQIEKVQGMKEGDTIGLPGDVQATVHEATSFAGDGQQVLRVDFD